MIRNSEAMMINNGKRCLFIPLHFVRGLKRSDIQRLLNRTALGLVKTVQKFAYCTFISHNELNTIDKAFLL